jgi:hypothetical protein
MNDVNMINDAVAFIVYKQLRNKLHGVATIGGMVVSSEYATFTISDLSCHLNNCKSDTLKTLKQLESIGVWKPYVYPQRNDNEKKGYFIGKINIEPDYLHK